MFAKLVFASWRSENVQKFHDYILIWTLNKDLRFLYSFFIPLQPSSSTLTQHELSEIWPLGYQMTSPHKPSIYGQEGWWVGNPCERANGVKYQSCYLWGETRAAVETPWCQRHAGYSSRSQIGFNTLRVGGACATTWSPRPPPPPQCTLQALG